MPLCCDDSEIHYDKFKLSFAEKNLFLLPSWIFSLDLVLVWIFEMFSSSSWTTDSSFVAIEWMQNVYNIINTKIMPLIQPYDIIFCESFCMVELLNGWATDARIESFQVPLTQTPTAPPLWNLTVIFYCK